MRANQRDRKVTTKSRNNKFFSHGLSIGYHTYIIKGPPESGIAPPRRSLQAVIGFYGWLSASINDADGAHTEG